MKKVSFYLFIISILISCNPIKRVAENERLLTKNFIFIDSVKKSAPEVRKYLLQKPNSKVAGAPISLYFYNIGNTNKPKKASVWGKKHPTSYKVVKNIFSEKQAIAYANAFVNLNKWFLTNGQAPVIINDTKIKKTVTNLKSYYMTEGYFNAKVSAQKKGTKHKKGVVSYFIKPGRAIFLDTIAVKIESGALKKLYSTIKDESFLKKGEQYNNQNFINEAKRIIKHFRNSGIYNFTEANLGFYNIDTTKASNYKTNVLLKITDELYEKNGDYIKKPFKIQKVKKINIYTDYSFQKKNEPYLDSISYKGYQFFAHKKVRYNPKYLSQSLFIKPNKIYSDTMRNLTRTHLKSLKNFKAITINYKILDDKNLEANIYLTPIETYTVGFDTEITHSNIRNIGISGKFSITNRNTFRGSELLKISALGSYFDSNNGAGWELGVDASLEIPRFVAPFGLNKLVPKRMNPRTLFSTGTSFQKNIGLDRQTFTVLADYKWHYNRKKAIQLEIFNTQYVKNLNTSRYFEIYSSEYKKLKTIATSYTTTALPDNEVENFADIVTFMNAVSTDGAFPATHPIEYQNAVNILNRYHIVTSDFLIPTIAYSFTYNNQSNFNDTDFSFLKIRIANSGNIMGLLSKNYNANNLKTVFRIPIAQYFKTDIEYKKFWNLSSNTVLGFRSSLGVILPYDGSQIPFTKSYFAGGSNDIRAWKSYSLGPGTNNTGLEYNIGSLKFITSAEYRFDIVSYFKGAFFIDAGNIWDISNASFIDDKAKFKGFSSIKEIAVGAGFGLRVDLSFLVLRLDAGFKTYEPYLTNDKWFQNFTFGDAVYNFGINYPF